MINIYKTNEESNKLEQTLEISKGCWINLIEPTDEEINTVCSKVNIEDQFIRYSLDIEEKARIDIEDDVILFIIDVPIIEKTKNEENFSTMPFGIIIVRDDFIITTSLRKTPIMEDFMNNRIKTFFTYKKTRFILQFFYLVSSYYLNYLRYINKETESTEKLLQKSMRNKEIIKMLSMEKSLVYFATSLKSNEVVMEKTLRGKIIKLYEEDEDILEDAIIENKQAIEMCKIYTDILSGTMDTYASIISNNLNIVMKFLASMTIVMAIPTMISSFFGMNVGLPFQNSSLGFVIILGISVIISLLVAILLKKKDMF